MKKWLRAHPAATTINELQTQLDTFTELYNHHRPHRSLPHRATPATAYTTRPKATPGQHEPNAEFRVRHDRVDETGAVTLRHNSRLHHIGIGRPHARTHIVMLIHDLHIRIINAATGEILRDLTLDTTRDYQPTGKPIGGPSRPYGPHKNKKPEPQRGFGPCRCLATSHGGGDERMSPASTTDFVVNVLVTALSKLASTTSAQVSH